MAFLLRAGRPEVNSHDVISRTSGVVDNNHTRYLNHTVDDQQLWDRAIKFARWQHPAVGCSARYAVPGALVVCYCSVSQQFLKSGDKRT